MKETRELGLALAGTLNSVAQANADGKLDLADLQYFFDDIFKWQEAIKDLTFAQEAALSDEADVEILFKDVRGQLNAFNSEISYDIATGLKGIYCIYRLAARAGWNAAKNS